MLPRTPPPLSVIFPPHFSSLRLFLPLRKNWYLGVERSSGLHLRQEVSQRVELFIEARLLLEQPLLGGGEKTDMRRTSRASTFLSFLLVSPVSPRQHWSRRRRVAEGAAAGEEAARRRRANRRSPQGALAGAGHRPPEGAPGTKAGGRRGRRVWFGTQGGGSATHRPVGEEEGAGSLG